MGSHAKAQGHQSPEGADRDPGRATARIDANIRAHLGNKLKAAYQTLVEEPVPDRFSKLLDELASKDKPS
jgi:hypothetical protein